MRRKFRGWTGVALTALTALTLAGCAMVRYGECFSRCGGNMPTSYDAPADPARGALLGAAVYSRSDKHTIFGFFKMERIGEPPGQSRVDARRYAPNVTIQQAEGSAWFDTTFGEDFVDPSTLLPRVGRMPAVAPLMPPGIYKLTSQASSVRHPTRSPPQYYPFRSPPQSTIIVVEAGKWTVLEQEIHVDESTEPMTVTVGYRQAGKEMLPLMRKSGGSSFSPEFLIADPLPAAQVPSPAPALR